MKTFACADGASIALGVTNGKQHIDYAAPEIDKAQRRVFVALETDTATGSAVVPFAQRAEGSTVFLPFNADRIYSATNSESGAAKSMRIWKQTVWSAGLDVKSEFNVTFESGKSSWDIDLGEIGNPKKIGVVVYAKDLSVNNGWGKFLGCSDATVSSGFGDKTIPRFLEIATTENAEPVVCARLRSETRVRIYQLFVRLFGNTNETRKMNGTLAENGVGKFGDINDTALSAISDMGFTHVWLTGVLRQATASDYTDAGAPPDDPDLLKGLAGSPYAIRSYFDVCPDYATDPKKRLDEFKALLARLHEHKLRTIIDLVPNHVARSYHSEISPETNFGVKDDKTKFFDPQNNFFYLRASDPGGGPPLKLPTCKDGQPISPTCKVLGGK